MIDARPGPGEHPGKGVRPADEVPLLTMSLLGGFQVERAGHNVAASSWQRRSAKTLTKMLATEPGHALHREQVLDILWPEVAVESALNSLSKAIHAARRALEPELVRRQDSSYLKLTDAMLVLDTARVTIDADRFAELAENALFAGDIAAYEAALAAYGGELLPEDRYEDWAAQRRDYLVELRIRLLLALAEEHERRGACSEAADRLREVLQHDPTRERAHGRLMRLYVEMGTPDQAVRQFHRCDEVLRRDLGLAPRRETVSLYQDIIERRVPWRDSPLAGDSGSTFASRQFRSGPFHERPFVGRERVIQRLLEQLTRSASGGPGMVLLCGEAGVGKTRLAEEFAVRARGDGATVLSGGGGAHASQFPCGPFAVALEDYTAGLPEAEREELARWYPALARFVPSVRFKGGPGASAVPARDDHLEVIPAIVRLFTDLSATGPLLFVLGDLPGTDPLSLDLLRYLAHLARWRPWLIIVVARDEDLEVNDELQRTIEATLHERLCVKIKLCCLTRPACDQLVRELLPADRIHGELLDQIYATSHGNPLFVAELVREAAEDNAMMLASEGQNDAQRCEPSCRVAPVPPGVRTLAASLLAATDRTTRSVLWLASAAPGPVISLRDFRTGLAALEPPMSEAQFLDALDLAVQLGILEEREDGYAFRYPLMRSALLHGLPLHRRIQFSTASRVPDTSEFADYPVPAASPRGEPEGMSG